MARKTLANNVLVDDRNSFGNPLAEANLVSMYERIRQFLPAKHRQYLDDIKNGVGNVDPEIELEMHLRLASLLATNAAEWMLRDGKPSRDLYSLMGEVRQSATAIEDIRRKRAALGKETEEEDMVIDPLQELAADRVVRLHAKSA